jgi:hypothetical protein
MALELWPFSELAFILITISVCKNKNTIKHMKTAYRKEPGKWHR